MISQDMFAQTRNIHTVVKECLAEDQDTLDGDILYIGDKIYSVFDEVHELNCKALLALLFDDGKISFALFALVRSYAEWKVYELVYAGYGYGGVGHSLRECRHIWFYPDTKGYGFYFEPILIKASFDILSKHFDFLPGNPVENETCELSLSVEQQLGLMRARVEGLFEEEDEDDGNVYSQKTQA